MGSRRLVLGFENEAEARRFWNAMRERLEKFALSLHSDKTRLIEFGSHAADNRKQKGLGKPETFNFLGFTFINGKNQTGKFAIKRKTHKDHMRAKLGKIKEVLRRSMHLPIATIGKWLGQVVRGYFNHHAVPTNAQALSAFRYQIVVLLRRTLRKRSQRDAMTWERIAKIADEFLPKPKITRPWPNKRFVVRHPRWEPSA
jgi:hypothetical protein